MLVRCAALLLAGKAVEWAVRRALTQPRPVALAAPRPVAPPVALPQGAVQPEAGAAPHGQGVYRVATLFVQELHVERPAPASVRRRFLGII
jgi:hypothetical protein